ncbi:MAG: hypothetical protein ABIJ95_03280 [Pseudomonadota bacterium]
MGFDAKAFKREKFTPRLEDVSVPDLAPWFGDGETPIWTVRNLTAREIARAREVAAGGAKNQAALAEILSKRVGSESLAAIREWAGESETPQGLTLKMEYFIVGTVSPDLSGDAALEVAIRMVEAFPLVFEALVVRIMELTGLGAVPGKSKPSGKTKS